MAGTVLYSYSYSATRTGMGITSTVLVRYCTGWTYSACQQSEDGRLGILYRYTYPLILYLVAESGTYSYTSTGNV